MLRDIYSLRIDGSTNLNLTNSPARNGVRDQVSSPSEPSIPIDDSPEDSMLAKNYERGQTQKNLVERDRCTSFRHHPHRTTADRCNVDQVTIDILTEDILLCIFNVYVNDPYKREEWRTLVHVCRRWRTLVFESPHHLNVQLFCSITTPVLAKLDIWPALPIVVHQYYFRAQKLDNLIAAIQHNDRVCKIDMSSFGKQELEKIVSVMQVPFPALTSLELTLGGRDKAVGVLPDLFLGRSAPRLEHLKLRGLSFPGLPNLLLSTTGLVSLELRFIPHSWDISPDAMVTQLSALTRLESLSLGFESRPNRNSHHSPPTRRTLIPALTRMSFEGANEYAEDLVTRIDTPRMKYLFITFFNETVFDISHLSQFISRVPKFQTPPDNAYVAFSDDHVSATLIFPAPGHEMIVLGIWRDESAGQLLSLIQLCGSFLPALAMVERLYIHQYGDSWRWAHGIQHSHWLQLLHFFTDTKDLYVSSEITVCIVPVLNSLVGERTTQVLPALQNLFFEVYDELSGPTAIKDFIAARELSGHSIAVYRWVAPH